MAWGNGSLGFFRGEGCEVHAWGKSSFADLPARLPGCDGVVVSVPIGVTREVIEWVGPHVREDSLLMDLTSLKTEPVSAMLRASRSEVIGLHPHEEARWGGLTPQSGSVMVSLQ